MDMEGYKGKAVSMLRGYRENEVCICMLEADLQALERLNSYQCNMVVSYDQPSSGATNKVISPVETELLQKERQREQLQKALARRKAQKQRIDLALENMPYTQRILLQMKYIDNAPWSEVAATVNHAEYYVKKELKEKALARLTYYVFPELSLVNLFAER